MQTLTFSLKSNNEEIINEKVNYILKSNILNFKIDNTLYKLNLEENILTKTDSEKIIKIDFNKEITYIELLNPHYTFEIPITKNKYETKDNILIEYTFESDEQITNCINIIY